jgi:polar amino acid transport system substrate-binding protein
MTLCRYYLHCFPAKLVVCWLLACSENLWADDGAETPTNLRFAIVYVEKSPFIYTYKYKGIVPYLAQALSRALDLELEYIPTSRKGLEATIVSGQADVTWLSPEWVNDKEKLIFSNPVFDHKKFL